MNKIYFIGFVVFAAVLAGLLFLEVTTGLISGVFPITWWLLPTIIFGLAASVTLKPGSTTARLKFWQTIMVVSWYSVILFVYFFINAWRYGPFGPLLMLVAFALPVVSVRLVRLR